MDVKSEGRRFCPEPVQFLLLALFLLPFGSANSTSGIARQVSNSCAPAATSPDVGSCSACHSSGNPSMGDLNAAGMQSQSGNFAFFCPASTPTPTPTPIPTPTPGNGSAVGGGGSGMSGMSGRSGPRGSRSGVRGSGSRFGRFSRSGRDDDGDDDDDREDDDREDDDD